MTTIARLLSGAVLFTFAAGCLSIDATEPPTGTSMAACLKTCGGCCDEQGLCRDGMSNFACGSVGKVCSVCTSTEECAVNACRPQNREPAQPPQQAEPGDVTLRWSFSGQPCAVVRGVETVTVDIPGLTLPAQGLFSCSAGAADGITIPHVAAELYRYTIRGLAHDRRGLYEATGWFRVQGSVFVKVDLQPLAGATGEATIAVRLPAGVTSAQPNVATLDVQVDGRTPVSVSWAMATHGIEVRGLSAGVHTATLEARDITDFLLYRSYFTLNVIAGAHVVHDVALQWAVGGLALEWQLSSHGWATTCEHAGISDVYLNLQRQDGSFLYPGAGVAVPCGQNVALFGALPEGRYAVFAQAVAWNGVLYRTDMFTPVRVSVTAGIPPLTSSTNALLVLSP